MELKTSNLIKQTYKTKLAALALPVKKDAMAPLLTKAKTFVMEPNAQNIRSLSFNFQNNTCEVIIKRDTGIYRIRFAANNWQKGETKMKGPYLVSGARNSLAGLPPFKVAAEYTWIDSNTLELVLRYIESPHTQTMLCRIAKGNITVDMKRSFNTDAPDAVITIKGKEQ
jgi:hypothetical protein